MYNQHISPSVNSIHILTSTCSRWINLYVLRKLTEHLVCIGINIDFPYKFGVIPGGRKLTRIAIYFAIALCLVLSNESEEWEKVAQWCIPNKISASSSESWEVLTLQYGVFRHHKILYCFHSTQTVYSLSTILVSKLELGCIKDLNQEAVFLLAALHSTKLSNQQLPTFVVPVWCKIEISRISVCLVQTWTLRIISCKLFLTKMLHLIMCFS